MRKKLVSLCTFVSMFYVSMLSPLWFILQQRSGMARDRNAGGERDSRFLCNIALNISDVRFKFSLSFQVSLYTL